MRRAVAPWGVVSAVGAPLLLIGGWTLAAARQPGGFDQVTRTISELAAIGTPERWIMTTALLGTGVCQVATALALRPAATTGRALLAVGGAATVLVGLVPLPVQESSPAHAAVAATAFVALAAWPLWSSRPASPAVPWGLRRGVAVGAGTVLLALVALFFVLVTTSGPGVGLAERLAAGAQTTWPLVVVLSCRTISADRRRVGDGP